MKTRRVLEDFEPYSWETPTHEIAAAVGLRPDQIVRLDTNTSQYRPLAAMKELEKVLPAARLNDYPDTSYRRLAEGLARYTGKKTGNLVVTNGTDEGLDLVTKAFIDRGEEAVIPTPTYAMYGIDTQLMGGRIKTVPRTADFGLDVDGILGSVGPKTKLVFLCNPNNPTGNSSPVAEVERIVKESEVGVVVDEAYFELCGKSAVDLIDRYDNVVVCRTLSKGFSMAGVRVGYLVGNEEMVQELNKIRMPNSLSMLSIILAEAALADTTEMQRHVRATVRDRESLYGGLRELEELLTPYPSEANFILFRLRSARADVVHRRLLKTGLVLRNVGHLPGLKNCLRTTVGTPRINRRLLAELAGAAKN